MRSTAATLRSVTAFLVLLLAPMLLLNGCGKGVDPDAAAALTSPVTSLRVTETVQFGTLTTITGSPLTFYVNGILGGNDEVGTVSATGLYTAPAIVPSPDNTVTITSIARDYPNGKPGSVRLAVLNPIPNLGVVTPAPMTEGNTTIFVNGTKFVYGAKILWNGVAVSTTYVSPTKLAATVSSPTPGVYPLLVRNPDPGSADSATLNENVGPGVVTIKLNDGPDGSRQQQHRDQSDGSWNGEHGPDVDGERNCRRQRGCWNDHDEREWLGGVSRARRCAYAKQHRECGCDERG